MPLPPVLAALLPIFVTVIIAVVLGRARDSSLAKRIGHDVNAQTANEDPVLLLEKLHQLREAGVLTEAEYEAQQARILEG